MTDTRQDNQNALTVLSGGPPVVRRAAPVLSKELVVVSDPQGIRAEAIRALRTHIMAQHVYEGRRALAVCAATAEVGCSFIAANLAVSLSQIGLNTLLIDANLRRPGIEALIDLPGATGGLRQCLASFGTKFADNVSTDVLPGLSIMNSGGIAERPQELLAGDRFKELIDFCLREFDVTIVDTPPANSSSDARRVSTVVGYSIIVARRNRTFVDDVKTLAAELTQDHAHVVGTVLNEG